MMDKRLVLYEEHFYEMLSYLVSSAYLMSQGEELEELMPSLRLMDSANRLIRLALESGAIDDDGWLRRYLKDNQMGLSLMGSDRDAFEEYLGIATLRLAKEMKRKNVT